MNIEMIDIREFNRNCHDKIMIKNFIYSLVVGVLCVGLGFSLSIIRKDTYYENKLLVIGEKHIIMNVKNDELNNIINYNSIIIDDKKYDYSILEIKNIDYYYSQVLLDVNLNKLAIENNIINCQILLKKESLLSYFVRIIRGEK